MICIKIYGCAKNKERKELLRQASIYFLRRVLPRKRNITISVCVQKFLLKREKIYGECIHTEKSPAHFHIRLDSNMPDHEMLSILAHEFIHVRQFDRAQLKFKSTCVVWNNCAYPNDHFSYEEQPWEIEASSAEVWLADEFKNTNQL